MKHNSFSKFFGNDGTARDSTTSMYPTPTSDPCRWPFHKVTNISSRRRPVSACRLLCCFSRPCRHHFGVHCVSWLQHRRCPATQCGAIEARTCCESSKHTRSRTSEVWRPRRLGHGQGRRLVGIEREAGSSSRMARTRGRLRPRDRRSPARGQPGRAVAGAFRRPTGRDPEASQRQRRHTSGPPDDQS